MINKLERYHSKTSWETKQNDNSIDLSQHHHGSLCQILANVSHAALLDLAA
jgi:hypothetical protein